MAFISISMVMGRMAIQLQEVGQIWIIRVGVDWELTQTRLVFVAWVGEKVTGVAGRGKMPAMTKMAAVTRGQEPTALMFAASASSANSNSVPKVLCLSQGKAMPIESVLKNFSRNTTLLHGLDSSQSDWFQPLKGPAIFKGMLG